LIIIFAELVVVTTVASCRSRSVVGNDAIVLRRSQLARRCCSRDDSVVDLEAALYLRSVDESLILISMLFFSTWLVHSPVLPCLTSCVISASLSKMVLTVSWLLVHSRMLSECDFATIKRFRLDRAPAHLECSTWITREYKHVAKFRAAQGRSGS